MRSGFTSRMCVGIVEDDGYVYTGPHLLSGYSCSNCIGKVEKDGYVYKEMSILFGGFASNACVGRVDTDSMYLGAGAALLLLF